MAFGSRNTAHHQLGLSLDKVESALLKIPSEKLVALAGADDLPAAAAALAASGDSHEAAVGGFMQALTGASDGAFAQLGAWVTRLRKALADGKAATVAELIDEFRGKSAEPAPKSNRNFFSRASASASAGSSHERREGAAHAGETSKAVLDVASIAIPKIKGLDEAVQMALDGEESIMDTEDLLRVVVANELRGREPQTLIEHLTFSKFCAYVKTAAPTYTGGLELVCLLGPDMLARTAELWPRQAASYLRDAIAADADAAIIGALPAPEPGVLIGAADALAAAQALGKVRAAWLNRLPSSLENSYNEYLRPLLERQLNFTLPAAAALALTGRDDRLLSDLLELTVLAASTLPTNSSLGKGDAARGTFCSEHLTAALAVCVLPLMPTEPAAKLALALGGRAAQLTAAVRTTKPTHLSSQLAAKRFTRSKAPSAATHEELRTLAVAVPIGIILGEPELGVALVTSTVAPVTVWEWETLDRPALPNLRRGLGGAPSRRQTMPATTKLQLRTSLHTAAVQPAVKGLHLEVVVGDAEQPATSVSVDPGATFAVSRSAGGVVVTAPSGYELLAGDTIHAAEDVASSVAYTAAFPFGAADAANCPVSARRPGTTNGTRVATLPPTRISANAAILTPAGAFAPGALIAPAAATSLLCGGMLTDVAQAAPAVTSATLAVTYKDASAPTSIQLTPLEPSASAADAGPAALLLTGPETRLRTTDIQQVELTVCFALTLERARGQEVQTVTAVARLPGGRRIPVPLAGPTPAMAVFNGDHVQALTPDGAPAAPALAAKLSPAKFCLGDATVTAKWPANATVGVAWPARSSASAYVLSRTRHTQPDGSVARPSAVASVTNGVLSVRVPETLAAAACDPLAEVAIAVRGRACTLRELADNPATAAAVLVAPTERTLLAYVLLTDAVAHRIGAPPRRVQHVRMRVISTAFSIDSTLEAERLDVAWDGEQPRRSAAVAIEAADPAPALVGSAAGRLPIRAVSGRRIVEHAALFYTNTKPATAAMRLALALSTAGHAPKPLAAAPRLAAVPHHVGEAAVRRSGVDAEELEEARHPKEEEEEEEEPSSFCEECDDEVCAAECMMDSAPSPMYGLHRADTGAGRAAARLPAHTELLTRVHSVARSVAPSVGGDDGVLSTGGAVVCGGLVVTAFSRTQAIAASARLSPLLAEPSADADALLKRTDMALAAVADAAHSGPGGISVTDILGAALTRVPNNRFTGVRALVDGATAADALAADPTMETLIAAAVMCRDEMAADEVFGAALAGVALPAPVHRLIRYAVYSDTQALTDLRAEMAALDTLFRRRERAIVAADLVTVAVAVAGSADSATPDELRALLAVCAASAVESPTAALEVDSFIEQLAGRAPAGAPPPPPPAAQSNMMFGAGGAPPPPPAPAPMMAMAMAAPGRGGLLAARRSAAPPMRKRMAPAPVKSKARNVRRAEPARRPELYAEAEWESPRLIHQAVLPPGAAAVVGALLAGTEPDARSLLALAASGDISSFLVSTLLLNPVSLSVSHQIRRATRNHATEGGASISLRLLPSEEARSFVPVGQAAVVRTGASSYDVAPDVTLELTVRTDVDEVRSGAVGIVELPPGVRPRQAAADAAAVVAPADRATRTVAFSLPRAFIGTPAQTILVSVSAAGRVLAATALTINVRAKLDEPEDQIPAATPTGATAEDAVAALAERLAVDAAATTTAARHALAGKLTETDGAPTGLAFELALVTHSETAVHTMARTAKKSAPRLARAALSMAGLGTGLLALAPAALSLSGKSPRELQSLVPRRALGTGATVTVDMDSAATRPIVVAHLTCGHAGSAMVGAVWAAYYGNMEAARTLAVRAPEAVRTSPMGQYLSYYIASSTDKRREAEQLYQHQLQAAGPLAARALAPLPATRSIADLAAGAALGDTSAPPRFWKVAPEDIVTAPAFMRAAVGGDAPVSLVSAAVPLSKPPSGPHVRLAAGRASLVMPASDTQVVLDAGSGVGAVVKAGQPAGLHLVYVYRGTGDNMKLHKETFTDVDGFFDWFAVTGASPAERAGKFSVVAISLRSPTAEPSVTEPVSVMVEA